MSEKEFNEKVDSNDQFADNLADDMPKEQSFDEMGEKSEEEMSPEEEVAKLKDSYIRLAAEYDNYRKRTMKEKADLIKNGGEKVLIGLLPVVDDFQRALETIENSSDLESLKEGVDLIYHKFINFLKQNGVKQIKTEGEDFNEDYFEAVAVVPAQSEEQKGKIVDNIQTGYMLHDRVIRHAKVVVAN